MADIKIKVGDTVFSITDEKSRKRFLEHDDETITSPGKSRRSASFDNFRLSTSNPNDATKKWENISDTDRNLIKAMLHNKLDLIQPDTRNRVALLFTQLDTDKSGELTVDDFSHSTNKDLNEKLQILWAGLTNNFDFDGNGSITQQEFLAYFILEAFTSEIFGTMQRTLGAQFLHFIMQFDQLLNNVCQKVENDLNGLFKPN